MNRTEKNGKNKRTTSDFHLFVVLLMIIDATNS